LDRLLAFGFHWTRRSLKLFYWKVLGFRHFGIYGSSWMMIWVCSSLLLFAVCCLHNMHQHEALWSVRQRGLWCVYLFKDHSWIIKESQHWHDKNSWGPLWRQPSWSWKQRWSTLARGIKITYRDYIIIISTWACWGLGLRLFDSSQDEKWSLTSLIDFFNNSIYSPTCC
jgi:hypothetical protein